MIGSCLLVSLQPLPGVVSKQPLLTHTLLSCRADFRSQLRILDELDDGLPPLMKIGSQETVYAVCDQPGIGA